MKKIFIPLLTVVVLVSIIFAGCVPGAAPVAPPVAPPVTPPVAPPVEPAPVLPKMPTSVAGTRPDINVYEGLAIKPDGTPYKFAYVSHATQSSWHAVAVPWTESIVGRAGGRYIVYDSMSDAGIQMSQLEDCMAAGIDGVMLHPVGLFEMHHIVGELKNAGIPTVTIDTKLFETEGVMSSNLLAHAGFDQAELGYRDGMFVIDYWTEKGEKAIVFENWGAPWHTGAVYRDIGFHEAVDPHPDIVEVIQSPEGDWTNATAMRYVEDALAAHPEINTIFSHSDVMSDGVVEGMRVSGRLFPVGDPQHIVFVSVDAGVDGYKWITQGYMDATAELSCVKNPDICMKLLFTYVILGQPVPFDAVIPTFLMTPDSAAFGLNAVTWRDYPGEFDLWPIYDYLVPTPTKLDPATVPANPMPGQEDLLPEPYLITAD